jgi:hypothetical protein
MTEVTAVTEVTDIQHKAGATLDAVQTFLERFISYPSPETATAHTLWIAHAHLVDAFENSPRLAFLSPEPGSGKSRCMELTEALVPRPVLSVNSTVAYVFRKISDEAGLPTLLMDEIDAVFSKGKGDGNEDLRCSTPDTGRAPPQDGRRSGAKRSSLRNGRRSVRWPLQA